MKKAMFLFFALAWICCLAGCRASSESVKEEAQDSVQASVIEEEKVLVVVFSATGTTKAVAEKIAGIEHADLYEILPAEPYTEEDLDYHDNNSRTTKEQNDPDARPLIASEEISLEGYKKVYLGYPIWHGQAPRIMSSFVEAHDFDGISVIPFCTSASSGIGQSGTALETQAGSGAWFSGKRFSGNETDDEIRQWIEGLEQ